MLFTAERASLRVNAVVARTVNDDLLHGFERVEVKLLQHQAKLALGIDDDLSPDRSQRH